MYSKAMYWNSIYAGTLTDAATVEKDFFADVTRLRPSYVAENKTRVFISYHDGPDFILYTLPIAYKKYITEG